MMLFSSSFPNAFVYRLERPKPFSSAQAGIELVPKVLPVESRNEPFIIIGGGATIISSHETNPHGDQKFLYRVVFYFKSNLE